MILLVSVAVLMGGIMGGSSVEVERCSVDVAGLDHDLDGLRIVQFTDFHSSRIGALEEEALAAMASLSPDIVAMTGDMTDDPGVAGELSRRIVAVQPPLGCFAVMGNAEYDGDAEAIIAAMREQGVIVLRNEVRKLVRGRGEVWLMGVDDPSTGRSFLEGALLHLGGDTATPRVLLAHFPTIFNQAVTWGIDIVLAGHTHGGQISLPGSRYRGSAGSDDADRFIRGDFRSGHTWMHVSRGVGTSRIPLRIGSPPEVTLIVLRRGEGEVRRPLPEIPTGTDR